MQKKNLDLAERSNAEKCVTYLSAFDVSAYTSRLDLVRPGSLRPELGKKMGARIYFRLFIFLPQASFARGSLGRLGPDTIELSKFVDIPMLAEPVT